jgi:hypothetical protein
MTNGRVEVITSVERRRRWSPAEKRRLVAAAMEPERAYRRLRGMPGFIRVTLGLAAADAGDGHADQLCAGPCCRGKFYRPPLLPAMERSRSSWPRPGFQPTKPWSVGTGCSIEIWDTM